MKPEDDASSFAASYHETRGLHRAEVMPERGHAEAGFPQKVVEAEPGRIGVFENCQKKHATRMAESGHGAGDLMFEGVFHASHHEATVRTKG